MACVLVCWRTAQLLAGLRFGTLDMQLRNSSLFEKEISSCNPSLSGENHIAVLSADPLLARGNMRLGLDS